MSTKRNDPDGSSGQNNNFGVFVNMGDMEIVIKKMPQRLIDKKSELINAGLVSNRYNPNWLEDVDEDAIGRDM